MNLGEFEIRFSRENNSGEIDIYKGIICIIILKIFYANIIYKYSCHIFKVTLYL